MSRKPIVAAVVAAAAFGLAHAAAAANLVVNGGFEDTTGLGPVNADGGYDTPQFTTFAGWTVLGSSNGVTLNGPTNPYGLTASSGDWSIDLTAPSGQGFGGIRQTIATEIGHSYRLTFDIGNSPAINGQMPARIGAQVGPTLPAWNFSGGGETGNAWQTITYDFVADAVTSELVFGGVFQGNAVTGYVGLDNVSVVDMGVPEPSAWALMLIGFGALGGAIRRSRRGQTALA
jgi:hypothetical protein